MDCASLRHWDSIAALRLIGGDQQLSLMSTWVDQLKSERESLASDKKGGPNSTANLVEKYGKCQEIVGRGAFGIVRISHKQDPADAKNELLYAVKEFRRRPQETSKKYQKRLTSEFCISAARTASPAATTEYRRSWRQAKRWAELKHEPARN